MNTTLRLCLVAATAATAALLSACGGGSDPAPLPPEPANTVPDSATASVRAYTEFTSALIASGQAGVAAAPLLLNPADAPTSESAVPLPVL